MTIMTSKIASFQESGLTRTQYRRLQQKHTLSCLRQVTSSVQVVLPGLAADPVIVLAMSADRVFSKGCSTQDLAVTLNLPVPPAPAFDGTWLGNYTFSPSQAQCRDVEQKQGSKAPQMCQEVTMQGVEIAMHAQDLPKQGFTPFSGKPWNIFAEAFVPKCNLALDDLFGDMPFSYSTLESYANMGHDSPTEADDHKVPGTVCEKCQIW